MYLALCIDICYCLQVLNMIFYHVGMSVHAVFFEAAIDVLASISMILKSNINCVEFIENGCDLLDVT
jgi:hypothetical protein